MSEFKTSIKNNYSTAVSIGHDKELLGVRPRKSKLTKTLSRFESGTRIPTLVVLEKYAAALGKRIE